MSRPRCPDCRTSVIVGVAPYPRCRKCGIMLSCCRRCRHYYAVTTECCSPRRPEPIRITDPDSFMPCCRLPESPLVTAARSPAFITLLAAGLLAIGLWVLTQHLTASSQRSTAQLFMRIPLRHQAQVGQPYLFTIMVFNPSPVTAQQVSLAIERSYCDHFEVLATSPYASGRQDLKNAVIFSFGALPAGKDLEIILELKPKDLGTWHGRLSLLSDGGVRHTTLTSTTRVGL